MRRMTFLFPVLVFFATLVGAPALWAEPRLPAETEGFVQGLLDDFDAGRFEETFPRMAPILDLDVHAYVRMVSERATMGPAAKRTVLQVETVPKHADLPEGQYLKITFETAFEKAADAKEIVVLAQGDQGYGLAGYQILYNRWPEALRMTASGLGIVFFIMALLAVITHYVGKLVQAVEKNREAKAKAKKEEGK